VALYQVSYLYLYLFYAWPFSVFHSITGFWPSYCQISTDLDKMLHTLIVVWNTLVGQLRPRSARGGLQAKPERLCFVILVTHLNSYIETTDRRDFGGKRVLSWISPEFCGVGVYLYLLPLTKWFDRLTGFWFVGGDDLTGAFAQPFSSSCHHHFHHTLLH